MIGQNIKVLQEIGRKIEENKINQNKERIARARTTAPFPTTVDLRPSIQNIAVSMCIWSGLDIKSASVISL